MGLSEECQKEPNVASVASATSFVILQTLVKTHMDLVRI